MDDITYRKCVDILTRIESELLKTLENVETNRRENQAKSAA